MSKKIKIEYSENFLLRATDSTYLIIKVFFSDDVMNKIENNKFLSQIK